VTLAQLIIVLNWIVGAGIPILVALVTRFEAKAAVKALVNLALNLLATAVLTIVAALAVGKPIGWFDIVFAFITGFIVSGASYAHLWKPTGLAPTVAQYGAGSGRHELQQTA
jgi:membrane-associated HD superfamily phosphohydrolase